MSAADTEGGTLAQRRKRALLVFELLRNPGASDSEIARKAKCSTAVVKPVRAALVQAGELGPGY